MASYQTYLTVASKSIDIANLKTKALTLSLKAFSAIGWAAAIWGITKLAEGIYHAVDEAIVTAEEATEKMRESRSAFDEVSDTVESLNGELETTKTRIDELEGKPALSFVEQEELARLKEYNKQLAISIDLADKEQAKAARDTARDAYDSYTKNLPSNRNTAAEIQRGIDSYADLGAAQMNPSTFLDDGDISTLLAGWKKYQEIVDEATQEALAQEDDTLREAAESRAENWSKHVETAQDKIDAKVTELKEQRDNMSLGLYALSGDELEKQKEAIAAIDGIIDMVYQMVYPETWTEMKWDEIFDDESMVEAKNSAIALAKEIGGAGISIDQFKEKFPLLAQAIIAAFADGEGAIASFVEDVNSNVPTAKGNTLYRDVNMRNHDIALRSGSFADQQKLTNFTNQLSDAQKQLWLESTGGANNAAEAIKMYEDAVISAFGAFLEENEKTISAYEDQLTTINEAINNFANLTDSDKMNLMKLFPSLSQTGITLEALYQLRNATEEQVLTFLEAVEGGEAYAQMLINVSNGLDELSKKVDDSSTFSNLFYDFDEGEARSFSDAIESVTSDISDLRSAYETLSSEGLTQTELSELLTDLLQKWPELAAYTDGTIETVDDLRLAIARLIDTHPDSLINSLTELYNNPALGDEMRLQVEQVIYALQQLSDMDVTPEIDINMDTTKEAIATLQDEMAQLAEFMSEAFNNGYTLNLEDFNKYSQIYPELLNGAEYYADGTVKLNEALTDQFIKAKEAQIKADAQARIQELENAKAVYQANKAYAQAKLSAVIKALSSENLADRQATVEKIQNVDAARKSAIRAGMDEQQASQLATQAMKGNIDALNTLTGTVAEDMATNLGISSHQATTDMSSNAIAMQQALQNVGLKAGEAAQAVRGVGSGTVYKMGPIRTSSSGSHSGGFNAVQNSNGLRSSALYLNTEASKALLGLQDKATSDFPSLAGSTSQLQATAEGLRNEISQYDKAIADINSQISMLQNGANVGLGSYVADYNRPDSDSGKDSSKAEKAAADLNKNIVDWYEWRKERVQRIEDELRAYIDQSESAAGKNGLINQMIELDKQKMSDMNTAVKMYREEAAKYLAQVPDAYKSLVVNGGVSLLELVGDGDDLSALQEAVDGYHEWAGKADDLNQEMIELQQTLKDLEIEKFQNIMAEFDMLTGIVDSAQDNLNKVIDLLDEQGRKIGEGVYEQLINQTSTNLELLKQERDSLTAQLNEALESGIEVGSDEWNEMYTAIAEVDGGIIEATKSIEEFNNAIQELHWDTLDDIAGRFGDITDQLDQIHELLNTDDFVTFGGLGSEWTEESLAKLGVLGQQYEANRELADKYAEEIGYLTEQYEAGQYSTEEYYEKLRDLQKEQYSAIQAYRDAEDAIIALNEARVNEAVDAIDAEVDAHKELIDAKIKEIEAEEELYNRKKTLADKNKAITTTAREVAALSATGTNAGKLATKQEELNNAKADLDDTLYGYSVEDRIEALNKEFEAFEKEKEAEQTALKNTVANMHEIIQQALTDGQVMVGDALVTLEGLFGDHTDLTEQQWQELLDSSATYVNGTLITIGEYFASHNAGQENDLLNSLNTRENLLSSSLEAAKQNYNVVYSSISGLIAEYGLKIDSSITQPWKSGQNALASYGADLNAASSNFVARLDAVQAEQIELQTNANNGAAALLEMFGVSNSQLVSTLNQVQNELGEDTAHAQLLQTHIQTALGQKYDTSGAISSIYSVKGALDVAAGAASNAAAQIANAIGKAQGLTSALTTATSKANDAFIVVNSATGAISTSSGNRQVTGRYAKGGVITAADGAYIRKNRNPLDAIAQSLGEDTMVAAKEGERILTQQQNENFERLVDVTDRYAPLFARATDSLIRSNLENAFYGNRADNMSPKALPPISIDASMNVQGSVDKNFTKEMLKWQDQTVRLVGKELAITMQNAGHRKNLYDIPL